MYGKPYNGLMTCMVYLIRFPIRISMGQVTELSFELQTFIAEDIATHTTVVGAINQGELLTTTFVHAMWMLLFVLPMILCYLCKQRF